MFTLFSYVRLLYRSGCVQSERMCCTVPIIDLNRALSRGLCGVYVNSGLKSLLSTFTCTQNASVNKKIYIKWIFAGSAKHNIFCVCVILFKTQLENLKKLANFFKFQSISVLAICHRDDSK